MSNKSASGEPTPDQPDAHPGFVIASPGRRVGAGLIDSLAVSLATALAFRVADGLSLLAPGWVAFAVAEFALLVAPVAITGRPLGAVVMRTVVIRATDRSVPGWSSSIRRWFVSHLPILIVAIAAVFALPTAVAASLAILQVAGLAVIYSGVLFDPSGQGLHDRAAKTLVVLHQPGNQVSLIERPSDQRAQTTQSVQSEQTVQSAAEERKLELMDLGAERLLEFVQPQGYVHRPPELSSVIGGADLAVLMYRPLIDGIDDVLVVVAPERDGALVLGDAIEAFAIRHDGRIDELTNDEWALVS